MGVSFGVRGDGGREGGVLGPVLFVVRLACLV